MSVGGVLVQISGVFILISECFISNSQVRERRSREEGLRKERSAVGAAASSAAATRAPVAPATGNVKRSPYEVGRRPLRIPNANTQHSLVRLEVISSDLLRSQYTVPKTSP